MFGKRSTLLPLGLLVIIGLVVTGCLGGGGAGGGSSTEPTVIIGVEHGVVEPASVLLGTTAEEIISNILPETVTVRFNNVANQTATVLWEEPADFDPDMPGDYVFTGSFTARELAGEVEVQVRLVGEIVIDQDITAARTLSSDYTYRVTRRISVTAPLTVEPGVQVRFENDASLHIENNGEIIAEGTEDEPILFTGTEKQRGWWRGIRVATINTRNSMKYVIIEYAGGAELDISTPAANLVVGSWQNSTNGRLVLQNSILRHGAGYGLNVRHSSVLHDSKNNTYTGNADGPAIMRIGSMHYLDSDSDYTGNDGKDYVVIENAGHIDANDTRTWQALNVPYRINGLRNINNSTITIEPRAKFEFEKDAGLTFQQESRLYIGSEQAEWVGEEDHVVFTGVEKIPGHWRGIQVISGRAGNFMNGVTIEYAGSSRNVITIQPANLIVGDRDSDGHLALQNSILRHSDSYGMNIRNSSDLSNSYGNIYTENAEGPVKTEARAMHYLDRASSYTGNKGNDFIFVHRSASSGPAVEANDTFLWSALDVPYRFSEFMEIEIVNSTIEIEPGAEFEFAQDTSLVFRDGSTLIANGTTAEPITFTGVEKIAGYWSGIQIATLSDNQMNHVIIEYGGGRRVDTLELATNLLVGGSNRIAGRLTLTDSIIRNSKGLGLLVLRDSTTNPDILTSNQFSNNQEGDHELH